MPAGVSIHVWEKHEIALQARGGYANPYTDVEVWVDLDGPGFHKRCWGFWDGGDTFRVRVLATAPGEWRWASGSRPSDAGLSGRSGSFVAVEWTADELERRPTRRGMVTATPNGRALQTADGTPFFLLGDTWWSAPTFRHPWYDDDDERPIGPGAGFKDLVRLRKGQGYNCIAMIAVQPSWANDGLGVEVRDADGTVLRHGWPQGGTDSVKDMHDERGSRPFRFPGRVAGFENVFPDVDRLNPEYFRGLDRKMDHLNAQGFVPFLETARRDVGQAWKKYHDWPGSYVRFIQYVFSRYQANNCILSPLHFDWNVCTIEPAEWREAIRAHHATYGPPPFGNLVTTNIAFSTLAVWGHGDAAPWLTLHQVGNGPREHAICDELTRIFGRSPPIPAMNGEPYYAGWSFITDAEGGSALDDRNCRSVAYGSVLSGGLAGHIYGADGLWGGDVEDAADHRLWDAARWNSGAQMQHLKAFVLSEGGRYAQLAPHAELLSASRSGAAKGFVGWAYCAAGEERDLLLMYFEEGCPRATLSGCRGGAPYHARWFDPRSGRWSEAGTLTADGRGRVELPAFPDGGDRSRLDWAMKLTPSA
jgi:hypothetical protein